MRIIAEGMGFREGSVQLYWKLALRFLKGLEDAGGNRSCGYWAA